MRSNRQPSPGSCDRLLEREAEVTLIRELLEAAVGGSGRLLVISGGAGIGKTSLLAACGEIAAAVEMSVMAGRGDELLMQSPFAAVRELLWPHLEQDAAGVGALAGERRVDPFDGAARLAMPVFALDPPARADPDRAAQVMYGLYWLVANLAERQPLAVLIDDAQWLDSASARFFAYLARRVQSLPVVLGVAVRRGENPETDSLEPQLAELGAARVTARPLSEEATTTLLRRELGARANEVLCQACFEATRGNPFYVRELARTVAAEPSLSATSVAEDVRELGVGAVSSSVLARLVRLGPDCEQLARAVAVLGPRAPLRRAAALANLDRGGATAAAEGLCAAGMLSADPDLSFAQPILRDAVSAEIPPPRRAAMHLDAARLLIAEHASPDEAAGHLLAAEPYGDEWVVDVLRAAAGDALARGAPEAAVTYLRRALGEPPADETRIDVLVELGRAELQLPAVSDFASFREALELVRDPVRRGEIAAELGWGLVYLGHNAAARELLERELASADELGAALSERLEALLIGGGAPDLTAQGMPQRVTRNVKRFQRGEVRDPVMLAVLAQTGAVIGLAADDVAALAGAAIGDPRLLNDWWPAYAGAIAALSWTDEVQQSALGAEAGLAEALRRGVAPMFMHMSLARAQIALRTGELELAEMHSQRALELARELGPTVEQWAMMWQGPLLLERGYAAQAAALLESVPFGEELLSLWQGVMLLADRGRVRLELGDLDAGVADLLEARKRAVAAGCRLSVLNDWAPPTALALDRIGRRDEALALAAGELADAIAFGAARWHGMALAVVGRLHSGEQRVEELRAAVGILERSGARLEHARALCGLGVALRLDGRQTDAREPLAAALDIAHRCGATALAEQVHAELVAAGARPRRPVLSGPESLTPAELRTARMAAGGHTNREIAQRLFLSTKTVEWQLSRAYAKLGVRDRHALASALGGALKSAGAPR